jgi:hypothetical protein
VNAYDEIGYNPQSYWVNLKETVERHPWFDRSMDQPGAAGTSDLTRSSQQQHFVLTDNET